MEFEVLTKDEVSINILKSKIESLEERTKYLEKNWVEWTKSTKDIGQKIMIALQDRVT